MRLTIPALSVQPDERKAAINAAKEHVVNSVMHLRNAFGTHGEARAIRFVLEAADRLDKIENPIKDDGDQKVMTQAEPCPGPYLVDDCVVYVAQPGSAYRFTAHVKSFLVDGPFSPSDDELAATARLLAASWDMRELLIELASRYSKASDEALKQWAATDLQAGRMIKVRKLLAEIETPVTSVPR